MESPLSEASLEIQAIDEANSANISIPFYDLQDIVKWSKNASENLYVIEQTTIFFPSANSTKLANVLTQAKPHRKLRLQGQIVVDNDQENQLIIYENGQNLNGAWIIHEGDFSNFSIGYPNTLWIPTSLGHLEIRTSLEYHEIFTEMMHAIGIFYVALFHYEDYESIDENEKDFNHVAAILNFYSIYVDGRGLFFKDLIGIATKYAKFMLNEYSKEDPKGALIKKHMFFMWLRDGCKTSKGIPVTPTQTRDLSPEQYRNYFEKARQRMRKKYSSPEPPLKLSEQPPDRSESSVHHHTQMTIELSTTSIPEVECSMSKPFHGDYISPQFPNGINAESSIPEKIAALICHAAFSGRQQLQKLTINSLANVLHRDYSISYRQVSHELLAIYRASIITYLPTSTSWKTSELYRELSASSIPSCISQSHPQFVKMQEAIRDYVNGTKKLIHRELKCTTPSVSSKPTQKISSPQSHLAFPMPDLPNRDPSIISMDPKNFKKEASGLCQKSYGIQRAAYRSLDIYD
ncbi:hypothetical protein OnM2_019076 [Erysiphe neolycopersici]|uniref:Uncharacterized protein n=1 Tax=Erysiphe neolycopersici TaxID=212602 RepID=A0A420I3Z1_9PEZI|nr:hypothetical protein OnM2_019076 [Erysiphe neolycopersici]